ncbi:MAG: potassium transporter TrkG [Legionellales bacterium]|jgi:trk system potassium uptake protein TrkH
MIQIAVSLRILGMILIVFSLTHVPAMVIALFHHEAEITTFLSAAMVTFTAGLLLWYINRNALQELRTRDGFFIIVLIWTVVGLFGAIPFVFSPVLSASIVDAVFESVSGLTTTGATVFVGLDTMPRSILYYRQQLHFLGGMGIIVLAVAILPLLGIGGLQLFRSEVSSFSKDTKLTPQVTQTAKALWLVYIGLNIACIIAYWLGGMSLFDAVCFAFGTISTGGFAPYDDSFIFPQVSLHLIATVFMLLGAMNFSLHFLAFRQGKFSSYFKDTEVKAFLAIQIIVFLVSAIVIFDQTTVLNPVYSLVEILFQVVSIGTTTGYTVTTFHLWPTFLPFLVLVIALIGGCSGSTAGGIRVVRMLLILKQGWREMKRLVHPHGYFLLKLNQKVVPQRVSDAVWGFVGVYFTVFLILMFMLMIFGLDFVSAFSGLVGAITTLGPGLGKVALNYGGISESAKVTLTLAMLLGRLELFAILILLTPAFWRQ